MLGAMNDTRHQSADGSVVGALAESLRRRLNQSELRVQELPEAVVRQRAIEASREAAALLRSRRADDQLVPYRDWIMALATTVAGASKEGGGLGSGDRVQPGESTVMDDVRKALEEGASSV